MLLKRLLISYYHNVWNRRDFRLLNYLFADTCKVNYLNKLQSNSVIHTPCDVRKDIVSWVSAFPDIQVKIKNIISNKEYVSAHCELIGRHTGNWMDVQPTGKIINIEIFTVFKVEGGKICEQWNQIDVSDVLDQIVNTNRRSVLQQAS